MVWHKASVNFNNERPAKKYNNHSKFIHTGNIIMPNNRNTPLKTGRFLRIHSIPAYISTLFLAEYENALLLLDAGCKCDVKRVVDFILHGLRRPVSDLKLVVSSHTHPDHAGGIYSFRKKYGIPVAGPHNLNDWYDGFGGYIQHKVDTVLGYWVAWVYNRKIEDIFYARNNELDFKLKNGTRLPFFSDWSVYETPGHTSHDMVIHNRKEKILYVGDLCLMVNGKFIPPFPVSYPDVMEKSLKKIETLDSEKVLFAHGGLLTPKSLNLITRAIMNQIRRGIPKHLKPLTHLEGINGESRIKP